LPSTGEHLPVPHFRAQPEKSAPFGAEGQCTVARIERALVVLAYLIELDGDVHLKMYERLEQDLEELTRGEAVKDRARRRLRAYADEAGRKTIC